MGVAFASMKGWQEAQGAPGDLARVSGSLLWPELVLVLCTLLSVFGLRSGRTMVRMSGPTVNKQGAAEGERAFGVELRSDSDEVRRSVSSTAWPGYGTRGRLPVFAGSACIKSQHGCMLHLFILAARSCEVWPRHPAWCA